MIPQYIKNIIEQKTNLSLREMSIVIAFSINKMPKLFKNPERVTAKEVCELYTPNGEIFPLCDKYDSIKYLLNKIIECGVECEKQAMSI